MNIDAEKIVRELKEGKRRPEFGNVDQILALRAVAARVELEEKRCESCDGHGVKEHDCEYCDGTGTVSGDCRDCDGTGEKRES